MSLPLMISAITLVVAIVIIIRIYPLLLVILAKLFFGKHSYKYLFLHKKFLGTSPYGYCIKDDFLNHLTGFYKSNESRKKFKTNVNILFGKTEFGTRIGHITQVNNKLVCLNALKLPQFELTVAGFRSEMFNYEMKTYYYFANNRFFMGEYSFKVPEDEKINEISSILQQKYLETEKVFNEDFLIENEHQAIICFEHNGFHLSIKYLNHADKKILELLDKYWDSMVVKINPKNKGSFESELKAKL